MKLETHAKIGVWVGIVALIIGTAFFTLHESQSLKYEYGRMFVDQDAMELELKSSGTFEAFTEKYPYFYEEFDVWRDGSGKLEVFAFNNQTGNRLELNIRYDQDDQKIEEYIHCQFSRGFEQSISLDRGVYPVPMLQSGSVPFFDEGNARGQFVEDFIKYTTCLDDVPKVISEPRPIPEPETFR